MMAAAVVVLAAACADEGSSLAARTVATAEQPAAPAAPPPAPMTPADSARARTRIAARGDSLRSAFRRGARLRAREVAELRQDGNAEQVATARALGQRAPGDAELAQLRRRGGLVALGDSTPYWVLRDMDYSVPYVTPDARAMLEALGRRFQARLSRLGLPPYRIKVTSALRTDATQADLRKTNSYAARTTSAHEFGTTVDVSHERFAVPAEAAGPPGVAMLEELGKQNARVLQAELGRALLEMRGQGALRVMMENQQPVYHMTVARRVGGAR